MVGSLEPTPEAAGGKAVGLAIPYAYYSGVYTAKIALTLAAIAIVWPGYRRFPRKLTLLGISPARWAGRCGSGCAGLDWEHVYLLPLLNHVGLGWLIGSLPWVGLQSLRATWWPARVGVGLSGRAVLRFGGGRAACRGVLSGGFVMRFVVDRDWWNVPFGKANRLAIVLGTAVPMLMHPGELLAAAVWFSLITWLMLRTRNIWDCVAAHAITNLILGIYVVHSNTPAAWRLM